jgi:hypothetical protein
MNTNDRSNNTSDNTGVNWRENRVKLYQKSTENGVTRSLLITDHVRKLKLLTEWIKSGELPKDVSFWGFTVGTTEDPNNTTVHPMSLALFLQTDDGRFDRIYRLEEMSKATAMIAKGSWPKRVQPWPFRLDMSGADTAGPAKLASRF